MNVEWGSSTRLGGCCFCSRYATAAGTVPHAVAQISNPDGGSLIARVCQMCLVENEEELRDPPAELLARMPPMPPPSPFLQDAFTSSIRAMADKVRRKFVDDLREQADDEVPALEAYLAAGDIRMALLGSEGFYLPGSAKCGGEGQCSIDDERCGCALVARVAMVHAKAARPARHRKVPVSALTTRAPRRRAKKAAARKKGGRRAR